MGNGVSSTDCLPKAEEVSIGDERVSSGRKEKRDGEGLGATGDKKRKPRYGLKGSRREVNRIFRIL